MDGKEEDREAALQVVLTSQDKICGVSHMLKKIMPLSWEVWFNGKQLFSNQEEIYTQVAI
jgi:putative redox protein